MIIEMIASSIRASLDFVLVINIVVLMIGPRLRRSQYPLYPGLKAYVSHDIPIHGKGFQCSCTLVRALSWHVYISIKRIINRTDSNNLQQPSFPLNYHHTIPVAFSKTSVSRLQSSR
jgi:hypothetical protein